MWRVIGLLSVVLVMVTAPAGAAVAPGRVVLPVADAVWQGTFNGWDGSWRAVALPDGGAVMVAPTAGGIVAARIRADGSVNKSFGTSGVAHVVVPHVAGLPTSYPASFEPAQVLRLADGRLIVVGTDSPTEASQLPVVVIVRLTPNGVLDPTFGEGGTARLGVSAGCNVCSLAALRPDGSLVISGTAWASPTGFQWVLVWVGADGRMDAGFGQGGIVEVSGAAPAGAALPLG